uniref:Uncharacterized protein n=1 Tax=Megaviridae environmental sample TaxID=1737588 RepID=A0A5J6VLD8_9VIRU|nr:MAG: hypothetical protein [Megaviridae environmental sample]
MADLNNKNLHSEWLNNKHISNNIIDYFFTQRKVTETIEELNDKLERIKKKVTSVYNFLAINFPVDKIIKKLNINNQNINIEIEIWGDKEYHFKGSINTLSGDIPNLLIRLKNDTQIFVKIILSDQNYISFIPINKRYQSGDNIL